MEEQCWSRGLGLVSMQERVHLVHGIFTIKSTVEAWNKNPGPCALARRNEVFGSCCRKRLKL